VSWNNLDERLQIKKINYQKAHRLDGACPDMAEERFSRLRRVEIDVDPHIVGACPLRHAGAPSLEEDAIVVTTIRINSMLTEIRVPTIADAGPKLSVGRWFKNAGDPVTFGEPLVEINTDNVTREIRSPVTGVLSKILVKDGGTVEAGIALGMISQF
jgi:Biotin-requiring enzyme